MLNYIAGKVMSRVHLPVNLQKTPSAKNKQDRLADSILHNEHELFRCIAEGDEPAFRQLFETYAGQLRAFFIRITKHEEAAREMVQEVFLNLWVYRSALRNVQQPNAYIYRIASNITAAHFRKLDMDRKLLAELAGMTEQESNNDARDHIRLKEMKRNIEQAVSKLPIQQQQVFRMSREQGLSRKEIAASLGIAEKTVRNHLTLSLKSVQRYLDRHHNLLIPVFLLVEITGVG